MINKKMILKIFAPILAAIAIVVAFVLGGSPSGTRISAALDRVNPAVSQVNYIERNEAGGERGGERGGEGEGSGANALAPNQTYDVTKNGARLVMNYDAASNTFIGTVENTTSAPLTRAQVEIHLSTEQSLARRR